MPFQRMCHLRHPLFLCLLYIFHCSLVKLFRATLRGRTMDYLGISSRMSLLFLCRGTEAGGFWLSNNRCMVIYEIIGNDYICATFDVETICQKAEMLLKKTVRNATLRGERMNHLRKWCVAAGPGDSLIKDEYTIRTKRKERH